MRSVAHQALVTEEEVERAAVAEQTRQVAQVAHVRRRRFERRWQRRLTRGERLLTCMLRECRLLLRGVERAQPSVLQHCERIGRVVVFVMPAAMTCTANMRRR